MPAPLLTLRGLVKRYGALTAVAGVDLDVAAGEIVALCGDNGAGKSSLIKMVSGAEMPSAGSITFDGRPLALSGPADALAAGIATIYQDLALAPRLPVWANVYLGHELVRRRLGLLTILDKARMAVEARAYLSRLGIDIADVAQPVERLSGGQRQAVAIARALRWDARLIIMDEPTAALGVRETAVVIEVIHRLKAEGRAVLLISHNMRDVAAVADRLVLLRGGRKVADRPAAGLSADAIGRLIAEPA